MKMLRTYTELSSIPSFEDRYRYLRLNGTVARETFGFDRYLNQKFYRSSEWRSIRDRIIVRDNGCDLGVAGHEIYGRICIHHMNPMLPDDLEDKSRYLIDPEYLISVSHATHNAIHYGDEGLLIQAPKERSRNDTCPWRH